MKISTSIYVPKDDLAEIKAAAEMVSIPFTIFIRSAAVKEARRIKRAETKKQQRAA